MKRLEKNDKKEGKGKPDSRLKKLGKMLLPPLTAGALGLAACADETDTYIPIPPNGQTADAGLVDGAVADGAVVDGSVADGSVADGSITPDSSQVADSGTVNDSSSPDSGFLPDAGAVDSGAMADSGIDSSAGSDSSVAADSGSGTACTGVSNASVTDVAILSGSSLTVGGYTFTYTASTTPGVLLDIDCGSSGASVASGFALNYGFPDTTINVPADGKKIVMTLSSRTPWRATVSISVQDL